MDLETAKAKMGHSIGMLHVVSGGRSRKQREGKSRPIESCRHATNIGLLSDWRLRPSFDLFFSFFLCGYFPWSYFFSGVLRVLCYVTIFS